MTSIKFLLFGSAKMTFVFLTGHDWHRETGRGKMSQAFSLLGNQGYCYYGCGRRQGKQKKKRSKYLLSTFGVRVLYHLIFTAEEAEAERCQVFTGIISLIQAWIGIWTQNWFQSFSARMWFFPSKHSEIVLPGLRGLRYKDSKCQITWDLGSCHGHTKVSWR